MRTLKEVNQRLGWIKTGKLIPVECNDETYTADDLRILLMATLRWFKGEVAHTFRCGFCHLTYEGSSCPKCGTINRTFIEENEAKVLPGKKS